MPGIKEVRCFTVFAGPVFLRHVHLSFQVFPRGRQNVIFWLLFIPAGNVF
jgi:hypothetical protein